MEHQLNVQGMTCGHCEKAVIRAVQKVDPQATVQVDRSNNKVKVQSALVREVLVQAISAEGYATH